MSIARSGGIARLVGVVAATILVACGPADPAADTDELRASQRGSVPLGDQYYPRSATSIEVEVQTCNGDPTLGSLEESADEISITIESTLPGDEPSACEDSLVVDLDEPVGDRSVVDATTGASLVSGAP